MVTNSTIEIINYTKTIDTEFNMKVLLIFTFLAYALILLYFDRQVFSPDNRASFKLMSLGAKLFYLPYLIFLPTFIYQLPITQDMGYLLTIQTYIYMIMAVYAGLVLAIYLIERYFKDWLGWELTMDGLKINMTSLVEKK